MSVITAVPRLNIAVAGATGKVGAALVAALAAEPVNLLALTRSPEAKTFPPGVTARGVDFAAPTSLQASLEGVDRLFLAQGTSPRQVENEIALIDAAVSAGVGHIVKLSAFGLPLRWHPFDWHTRIEAHLASRDIGYTMLRPSTFMNVLVRAGRPVAEGTWGGAAGHGVVNLIDVRDVADAARAVLLDEHSNSWQRAFHLTGPRAWSMPEIAAELSGLLGRTVTYEQRSLDQQRAVLMASGLNEFAAGVAVGLDEAFSQSALREDTSTVQLLTGHAPRSLTDWLRDNLSLFKSATPA
ncbi:NAD(P)H-binding protein [Duganella callida]|uniref:SDR family NAD(P)-dependent oxidoreductase n=1 Tax=Duganella callida TaxID=2561932 RepID=A0A4Y9SH44_9BURK|nr:NmrA family NAD(P)-binding protein [Duganella callida]TFW23863.1 SDR family NAD(P)-dependent oxidoreductase [Duganella callida]